MVLAKDNIWTKRMENQKINPYTWQLKIYQSVKNIKMEKNSVFNKWCWENWIFTCKNTKPWAWGISSRLLQQSTATAPYLGRGVSPHRRPSWPSTWDSSSRPSCAPAATAPWTSAYQVLTTTQPVISVWIYTDHLTSLYLGCPYLCNKSVPVPPMQLCTSNNWQNGPPGSWQ